MFLFFVHGGKNKWDAACLACCLTPEGYGRHHHIGDKCPSHSICLMSFTGRWVLRNQKGVSLFFSLEKLMTIFPAVGLVLSPVKWFTAFCRFTPENALYYTHVIIPKAPIIKTTINNNKTRLSQSIKTIKLQLRILLKMEWSH